MKNIKDITISMIAIITAFTNQPKPKKKYEFCITYSDGFRSV